MQMPSHPFRGSSQVSSSNDVVFSNAAEGREPPDPQSPHAAHINSAAPAEQALTGTLQNLFSDAVIVARTDGTILTWNDNARSTFGFTAPEAEQRNLYDLLGVRLTLEPAQLMRLLEEKEYWIGETGFKTREGKAMVALCRWELADMPPCDDARLLILSVAMTDLQKQVLEASALLSQSEQRFDTLFGQHPDGVFSFNMSQRLSAVNPTLTSLTGYTQDELMRMSPAAIVQPGHLDDIRAHFRAALQGKPQSCELSCLRKDGSAFDAHITMLPNIINHRIVGLLGIVRDVSHRRENEKRIQYLATHDPLTGLPNRNMLEDRMQHAIEQARRLGTQIGVLFLDLNRFKLINDTLGHDKGDILLCTVAQRLRTATREADTVSRLGGDEFVIVLENLRGERELSAVARTILAAVCQPLQLESHLLTVSTSIGGSIFPLHGSDKADLLKRADLAMYEAKNFGAGHFMLYSPEMDSKAAGRLVLENALRHALSRHELVLHYQPRLDVDSNRIAGVEALLRWDHPQRGMIFPVSFISMAEEIGLIDAVGEWVLVAACRQLQQWREAGLNHIRMSVNLSALQLRSATFCHTIERILHETGIDAASLELEITESSLMHNLDAALRTLKQIRSLGITLSIDDFGTGYSSLSYLKQLPIDTIKIDKSFVRDIPQDGDDAAIVSATIAMAHNLNLKVVAEGVTSFEQMHFLQEQRCDEIQGYLLCQPLPAIEAESFFKTCTLRGIQHAWVN